MNEAPLWPRGRLPAECSVQESWVLSYAGWYRYYLEMQPVRDHLALRWAESMADAVVQGNWFFPYSPSPDRYQRLKEGFSNLQAVFRSDRDTWLRKAWELTERDIPDPCDSEFEVLVIHEAPQNPSIQTPVGQLDLFG